MAARSPTESLRTVEVVLIRLSTVCIHAGEYGAPIKYHKYKATLDHTTEHTVIGCVGHVTDV